MAVPHLDTRVIDGRKLLLFGPFASWTTKFLHNTGSFLDLPLSIRPDNIATLLKVGVSNLSLVKYLVQQGTQSMAERINVLRRFYPAAQAKDWKLIDAGIRVQAIKKTDGEAGIVHYGTEIVASTDRSLSGLMGASPGASVCVDIALEVIQTCLPHLLTDAACKARLLTIFPTYDADTKRPENADLYRQHAAEADRVLQLV
jgi:malate dehydrogenase (quinone)